MGLGDILGSLNPAYGAISGQGFGGVMRNLSPAFLMARGLGGGDAMQPNLPPPAPAAATLGPNISQALQSLPTMDATPQPSLGAGIGSALSGASGGGNPRFFNGLSAATPQNPMRGGHSGGLAAILQQLGVM